MLKLDRCVYFEFNMEHYSETLPGKGVPPPLSLRQWRERWGAQNIMRPSGKYRPVYCYSFTLIELMIAVAIIGVLSALAIPGFMKAREASQNVRFVGDLRVAVGAFEEAILTEGHPPDANPAVIPTGMENYLDRFPWRSETPIGGRWDWDYQVFGYNSGVSVFRPDANVAQLQKIDALFDDGDLNNGIFRARNEGYIRIIEFEVRD